MDLSSSLEPMQLAAEAHAEVTRVRRAKVQLLNRVAQQSGGPCDAGRQFDLVISEAFIATLEQLKTFDRYEQRSIAKREQALRTLSKVSRAQLIRTDHNRRFGQPLNQLRIDRIVKTAILQPQSPNMRSSPFCLTVDFASTSSSAQVRALVQLRAADTGTLRIDLQPVKATTTAATIPSPSESVTIDAADPTKPSLSATFAISKVSTAIGGGRWVARCPKTARHVSHLYWCAGTGQLGSRLALNLSYRSKATGAGRDAPGQQISGAAWLRFAKLIVQEEEFPAPLDCGRDWTGRKRRPKVATETVALARQTNDASAAERKRQARRRQSTANVDGVRSSPRPGGLEQSRVVLPADNTQGVRPRQAPTSESQATVTSLPVQNVDPQHRQRTLAVDTPENVEGAGPSFVSVDAALADASELMQQGKFDAAVAAIRVGLAALVAVPGTAHPGHSVDNPAAQDRLQRLLYKLVELAKQFLLSRAYRRALELADEAFSYEPTAIWIQLTRFHACMFMARITDAMTIFRRYRHERIFDETSWQAILLEQFAALKAHGLSHPLMDVVRQQVNSEREPPR
jgi:hypothetical protein